MIAENWELWYSMVTDKSLGGFVMRKRGICVFLLCCLLLCMLCGCRNNSQPTPSTTAPTSLPDDFTKTMVAVSVPATTETVKAKDGTTLFEYTYQHISLVLHKPTVADKIIVDFLGRVDSTKANAESAKLSAQAAYNGSSNWVPYLCHVTYSPTRVDHKVLSLFGNNVIYTGGKHPDWTCTSANYDISTGDVLTLSSILAQGATTDTLHTLTLESLRNLSEGDYLYEDYANTVNQRFTADPKTDEAWYFTQTGLCFYFAPYEIAPYASGVVTVEIPYEKLTGLLKSEYLPAKRAETQGSVTLSSFANIDFEQFQNIAELVTDNVSEMFMAYTEGNVQDVRILVADKYNSYTVFAVYNLSASDGIMIQATADLLAKMSVQYKNGNKIITEPLVQ